MGRVELRGGAPYRTSPQHIPHVSAKMSLFRALDTAVAREPSGSLDTAVEGTVRWTGFSPTPDILAWEPAALPEPIQGERVRLIVEVAVTTLADDLGAKREA